MNFKVVYFVISFHISSSVGSEYETGLRAYVERDSKYLKLVCNAGDIKKEHTPLSMNLYDSTYKRTLVEVNKARNPCPTLQNPTLPQGVYVPLCDPKTPHPATHLEALLFNYNPNVDRAFTCNFTFLKDTYHIETLTFNITVNRTETKEYKADSVNSGSGSKGDYLENVNGTRGDQGTKNGTAYTQEYRSDKMETAATEGSAVGVGLIVLCAVLCLVVLALLVIWLKKRLFRSARGTEKEADNGDAPANVDPVYSTIDKFSKKSNSSELDELV